MIKSEDIKFAFIHLFNIHLFNPLLFGLYCMQFQFLELCLTFCLFVDYQKIHLSQFVIYAYADLSGRNIMKKNK